MPFSIDLSGRRALVTGAGQNIGRETALALARAGAEVVVNDLVASRVDAVVGEIAGAGGVAIPSCFDVTDWEAVTHEMSRLHPDILVNNAGNSGAEPIRGLPPPFLETEPADWEKFIRVNLYGVLYCTRAALPFMVERRWGRVVSVISDAARRASPRLAAYAAAKAGAAALMRVLAAELGDCGITLNSVSLGTVDPDPPGGERPPGRQERFAKMVRSYPAGRLGRPDDPASLIVLLASDLAQWMTGQTYPVNGGYTSAL